MLHAERIAAIHDVLAVLTWWMEAREAGCTFRGEAMPVGFEGGCQYLSDNWSLANTIREVKYQLPLISLHSLAASSWASLRFRRHSTPSSAFKVSCMLHPAKDPVTRTCEKSPSQAQLLLDKKDHLAWERLGALSAPT